MIWLPILATLVGVVGTVYAKQLLRSTRIPEREFLSTSMLVAALLGVAILGWQGELGTLVSDLTTRTAILLVAYGLLSALGLWLYYQGFREESLTRYELATLTEPIFVFLAVGLVFPEERDLRLYAAAAIALGAYAMAHLRRHHLQLQHGERLLLLATVLFGIEGIFEQLLVTEVSPLALTVLLHVIMAATFTVTLGFHLHRHLLTHRFIGVAIGAAIRVLYFVLLYGSFQVYGVTATNVVLLATPVLLYGWAHLFYGEREPWKMTVAGVIILATVAYVLTVIG